MNYHSPVEFQTLTGSLWCSGTMHDEIVLGKFDICPQGLENEGKHGQIRHSTCFLLSNF